jgi:hypothetical protein
MIARVFFEMDLSSDEIFYIRTILVRLNSPYDYGAEPFSPSNFYLPTPEMVERITNMCDEYSYEITAHCYVCKCKIDVEHIPFCVISTYAGISCITHEECAS